MQSWKDLSGRRKLAIAAAAAAVLVVGGVVVANQFGGGEPVQKRPARVEDEPRAVTKPAGTPLELGEVAKISDNYRVAVTEVSTYKLPKGLLVVPTMDVTYIGDEDGEPWADLTVEFAPASGARTYGETDCIAGLGNPDVSNRPPLAEGEEATHEVCIELPSGGTEGGRVYVEEAYSGDRTAWSTDDAVRKVLPSVAPQQPGSRPGGSFSLPNWEPKDPREACDKWDQDQYDDYKEWGAWVEEKYEQYRDAGGDDEDKIEDYEEWKEEYDKQIEYFDKWEEIC